MRTEQLSYFIETAQHKSIRAAAEHLFITQQSLNTSIQKLEKEMGAVFFDRTSQGIQLTQQGAEMLTLAQNILDQIFELKFKFQLEKNISLFSDQLTILVSPMTELYFIPEIISLFSQHCPNNHIDLLERTNSDIFYILDNSSANNCD